MSEVAIILSDVPAVVADVAAGPAPACVPALARFGRFGCRASVAGWRTWLAGWLGRPDLAPLAGVSPAVVAAAAVDTAPQGSLWLATPVHLTAGLRSVHMPPDGLLRLGGEAADDLVRQFNANFGTLGFTLRPAPGGGFLAQGPRVETLPVTTDPASLLGADLAGATPQGPGSAPLLRLGAELEMWLHEHPLNLARAQLRLPCISTLWLWGGGLVRPLTVNAAAAGTAVLADDAFAAGLCALSGGQYQGGAPTAQAILDAADRHARVAAVVALLAAEPASAPAATTVHELLQRLDAQLLAPLLAALGRSRGLQRLSLVANGSVTTLGARAGLKFWRRSRAPLTVLR